MAKTQQEKLFGAACLKLTLEAAGGDPGKNELYQGALADLAVSDAEVQRYLEAHRTEIEAALAAHRRGRRPIK